MKTCLDARKWFDGGIGVFIRLLAEQLVGNGIEVIAIARSIDREAVAQVTKTTVHVCDVKNYSFGELITVGQIANRSGADLYYAPHYVVPFHIQLPIVTLIHDTIQMEFPDQFSLMQRSYARYMIGRALRVSQRVITQSETVRRDLLKAFPKTPEIKIEAVKMVFDPEWGGSVVFPPVTSVPQPYCIYFGAYRKHKNLLFLANLWQENRDLPPLVLVGDTMTKYPELREISEPLLTEHAWFDMGEVPFPELVRLVQNSLIGVFPSKYEGYGQPPLETMACGVPAIVSDCGAFPEIAGGGATVLSLENSGKWAEEIRRLQTAEYRKLQIEKGNEWIKQFSIQNWINGHIRICREAVELRR